MEGTADAVFPTEDKTIEGKSSKSSPSLADAPGY